VAATALAALAGCQPTGGAPASAAPKPAPPAKVEGAPKEADLATVKLTAEAETHLGVVTAEAARKPVPRTTTYAGVVTIPPGRLTAVTAPFVGLIKAPPGGAGVPKPGAAVKEGQPVLVLVPILSPEAKAMIAPQLITAEGAVKQAKEQLNIAKVNLDRAEDLRRINAVGAGQLVDARAQFDLAQTNLRNAEAQRETLAKVAADAESGSLSVQTIEAPTSGVIQNVHAQSGQKVAVGAALFEVIEPDPIWVRVPVYVGELSRLANDRPAAVGSLSDAPGASGERPARPIDAPPSGDPLAFTVDVFYEVANKDGLLRPGERVSVTLPLRGDDESLTVPRASLIRDIHGGAWVYEKVGDHTYARRRVLVERIVGDLAVLVYGPKPGAKVVTDGSAELYGAEFGGSK
jgi:RND family efflux transporter MFP subunit